MVDSVYSNGTKLAIQSNIPIPSYGFSMDNHTWDIKWNPMPNSINSILLVAKTGRFGDLATNYDYIKNKVNNIFPL